jgi:ribosome maturation factor RimP
MRSAPEKLTELLRPVVESLGYELVGIELLEHGPHGRLLRVYIDHEQGITVDDCGAVSHRVSGVLDVEDPIPGHYDLEVSSPGLDRPLFEAAHFERFKGSRARLKLRAKLDGRRKLVGVLGGLEERQVLILEQGECYRIPLELIESARLVPEF